MKTYVIGIGCLLILLPMAVAEDGLALLKRIIVEQPEIPEPESTQLLLEIQILWARDPKLPQNIAKNPGKPDVIGALLWSAARSVNFHEASFFKEFPALSRSYHVLSVTKQIHHQPRIIFRIDDFGRGLPAVRMLHGEGSVSILTKVDPVRAWNDPQQISDWIGDFHFRQTSDGPYLLSVTKGRQTTGATSIREIHSWIRVENTRLVVDRIEAYDVPIGQQRKPEHLKARAIPIRSAR